MEPPDPGAPGEPTPPRYGPPVCPNCGAEHEPDQEYCLECGRRLPGPSGGVVRRTELWSRESPAWLWATLIALLLVALVAGAVALAARDDDDQQGGGPTVVPNPTTETIATITGPLTFSTPATTGPAETVSTSPTTVSVPTFTNENTKTENQSSSDVRSWPVGKDGFTNVLASVPTSRGRGAAERKAESAIANGLPEVGILNSSDYLSLNPGYYVVFSGIYDSKSEAESHLAAARSFQPLAYVREVTP